MDHHAIDIKQVENEAARSPAGPIGEDRPAESHDDAVTRFLASVRRQLGERIGPFQAEASSRTIFRIPQILREINPKAEKPEIVSIGPYHRGQGHLRWFEGHKWFFLKSFLRRTYSNAESLIILVAEQEKSARGCYSEPGQLGHMSSSEFVEMMLLDGCFVVEFLLRIFRSDYEIYEDDPILSRPGITGTIIRDLLKLENQVPYSLLKSLFDFSSSTWIAANTPYLCMLALRVFNRFYPRPMAIRDEYTDLQYRHYDKIKSREYKHLLDLFNFTLFLTNPVPCNYLQMYRPSDQSIPSVTQLRSCGIKFKSKKAESFLDISFQKRVLEIPRIAINDFMTTVLINCIALEQCQENSSKHITDYVSFMRCLINQPKDVSLLCSDGIISTLSCDDQYVVNLFNKLGKGIVFSVHDCYLSKQYVELESDYYSNWASMMRTWTSLMDTYFSSPWSAILVFSVFLMVALTVTQTVYAVLGQQFR